MKEGSRQHRLPFFLVHVLVFAFQDTVIPHCVGSTFVQESGVVKMK